MATRARNTRRIQIASDLHLEFGRRRLPPAEDFTSRADRDLLVLAGDIALGIEAWTFVQHEMNTSPVVYVPGNHEYYVDHEREAVDATWRERAAAHPGRFFWLNPGSVTVAGLRVHGAAGYSALPPAAHPVVSGAIADFTRPRPPWTTRDHHAAHLAHRAFLANAGPADVVVTHWPFTEKLAHPDFISTHPEDIMVNRYFANHDEALIRKVKAKVRFSGHTHHSAQARVGRTRCVANSRGYPREHPNRHFNPARIVDVGVATDATSHETA